MSNGNNPFAQLAAEDAQKPSSAQPPATPSAPTSSTATSGNPFAQLAAEDSANNQTPPPTSQPDVTLQEYASLPPDQQKAFDEHVRAGRSILDPATGFIKGVGDTVNTLSGLLSRVAPSVVRPQDVNNLKGAYTATPGTLQSVGKVGEGIAEFFLGDEALKGLSIAEKLGLASKVAKLAESSPVVARIIGHGLNAVRGGTVTAAQQLAHGATPTEAAKTGAEATILGAGAGAATEGVSAVANKVVGSDEAPTLARKLWKGKDVAQPGTQAAVRSGVQSSAEATPSVPKLVMEDVTPPSLTVDAEGNPVDVDGQHRAALLAKAGHGDEPFTIKYTDAAGKTTDQEITANQFLKRLNRTPEDILATDEQQSAVRAGNGEPRPAVNRPVARPTEATLTPAANPNEPLLSGNKTIVDDHINRIQTAEKQAYKNMDEVAGFDVKAEKTQLANDKYKLSQLGNTDADVTQRGNLVESINDSEDRIAEAETRLKDAGVDPDLADSIHKQRMAAQDFKKVIVRRTNVDGSVDIDGLLKDSKNLRFAKQGDRLTQFMGKDAAEQYMSKLQEMQKLGAHAVKMQSLAKWIGGAVGLGLGGTAIGVVHHALTPVTVP
jgi:hypothetical protein